MINNVCKSKKNFASIKSHHSYPKFGTVKVWKKNCGELKKIGNTKPWKIASFHPAFLMRQPEQKKLAWIDLKMIREKYKILKI